jgi:hypothetical protein
MSKIIRSDGIREQVFHETDSGYVIETSQNIDNILAANKEQLDFDKQRTGFVNEMHHVARIPLTVIDDLNKKGVMKGFVIVDDTAFAKWLNGTEIGQACKTYRGQL